MSTQTATGDIPRLTLGWRLKMSLGSMSVQEMANNLGRSRNTLSRWMADKGEPPAKAFLKQWALATGVNYDWLESGVEPSGPDDGGDGGTVVTDEYPRVSDSSHASVTELHEPDFTSVTNPSRISRAA